MYPAITCLIARAVHPVVRASGVNSEAFVRQALVWSLVQRSQILSSPWTSSKIVGTREKLATTVRAKLGSIFLFHRYFRFKSASGYWWVFRPIVTGDFGIVTGRFGLS